MITMQEEKDAKRRFHKAAAVAALLIAGAMTSGCSHPAAPPTPTAAAPAAAPAAPGTPGASPMSPGDQEEMQRKQAENKGQAPPP